MSIRFSQGAADTIENYPWIIPLLIVVVIGGWAYFEWNIRKK